MMHTFHVITLDAVSSLVVSSFSQETINQRDNIHTDSGDMIPEVTPQQQEEDVENTNIDINKLIDTAETNEVVEHITEEIMQVQPSETPSLSEQSSLVTTLQSNVSECILPEPVVEDKPVESISSPTVAEESQEPPVQIQEVVPGTTEGVINDLNTSVLSDETVQKSVSDEVQVEEMNTTDPVNDSEQMEDVVQLTVGSPDLVDEEEAKTVEETSHVQSSDILVVKQDDIIRDPMLEDKQTLAETPKLITTHPKRKWGSCKTRIPITISPFTLGTIIESNGDSFGDNGEYRSEEGEIQKTDSEEEHINEEAMDINDTMLIDIEAVDYEAPEEEEKAEHEDSKSEKSNEEELVDKEPKKKTPTKRTTTTNVIHISNLVRPFTVGQLRDLLQRTGKIVPNGFWIDAIKSQCIVEYENEDQAVETVYALNESQWPSTNPKFLKVVFTNKEELNKALNGTYLDQSDRQKVKKVEKLRVQVDNHNIILREWDRGKLEDMNGEDDTSNKRKLTDDNNEIKEKKTRKDGKDSPDKRKKSKSKTPERVPTKSLDELFRKTKTTPTLYWSPLSAEQIAEKEDQRRKHLADIERSQKTNRRRRDNNHYPRRR
ncbi:apoptotic chromatin condensation inducer in the nucleus isoform X2 [Adelges cooleyi]|uniref:apoptotic chromatin condensation inducer in the nucleus isoform X2 n=1 Tax=Adelges cooleyi TaxID=133065 RepID=UPI00217F4B13|nr:apoptotic chromatin condensation inducer in the nucleus isoform X2 [Adelges cooleyi]